MAQADPGMLTDWYSNYMKSQPKAEGYSAASAGASVWKPDADSTVQGQLTKVLDKGGPLMQRATTRAAQQMNSRGLLNSSIAVGAGQSALYDAATPIAATDAGTFASAGKTNAELGTQVSIANAGFSNDANRFSADARNQATTQQRAAGIQGEQTAQQRAEQALGRTFTTSERLGAQGFQAGESALERENKGMLQQGEIAAEFDRQTRQIEAEAASQGRALTAQEQQQLRDIAAQKERQQAEFGQQTAVQQTDIAAKLDQQMRQIQADAQTQGRALTFQEQQQLRDLQNQKDMQAAGFTQQTNLQNADFAQQNKTQAADLASRYDLANMDVQSRAALQAADIANQQKLQQANAALQTGLQASDAAVKQSMQVYDAEVKKAMQGLDNQSRLQVATLDADNRVALAGIEAKYKNELQANQSMAASYQSMVDGMTRIMVSPDMDAAAKQKAIGNLTTLYNNTIKMQSDVSGLKLGELLNLDDLGIKSGDAAGKTTGQTTKTDKLYPPVFEGGDG